MVGFIVVRNGEKKMRKTRDKDGTRWTCAEVNFLAKNMDADEEVVAKRLGRSMYAVMSMKYKIKSGYEVPDDDYIPLGKLLTPDEKVSRIYKMAAEMRVRLAR